ncbi:MULTISPECIES: hypothetical protein [Rhodanobacter]|uniref:hypothetical protein n=1 Tax=Rhodanobacter TaxID=75309 RepID=UPI0004123ED6|nr:MULTISPECIES: hypothetical protein [Rhodanobacter]UJM95084.1 hypothetical protein LRK32_06520 [Rhodanobacter denitrificans]UJM98615.1 hypothetical protein LRK44_06525 [Rhodanobacter denitrificans]UJN21970.1 hypothetical protein LRK54_01970 [Rhodanobacter denitrificans]
MNEHQSSVAANACAGICTSAPSIEALNSECFCLGVDAQALHASLDGVLGAHGLPEALAVSHPHLFSVLPIYVSRRRLEQAAKVVAAIEEVTALPTYRLAVMAWAPDIARFEPGSPGGLLGLDFHMGRNGPQLIEINTNPGGVLLNAVLGQAQRACMSEVTKPPTAIDGVDVAVLEVMLTEWRLQRGSTPLGLVVIVDESPQQQYLYPEFVLFRELFRRHGYRAEICGPEDLVLKQDRLWLGENAVDMIYNRLTDFAFEQPAHAAIRIAYLAGTVAVSPHPRAHALYSDKRNLSLLGNRDFLESIGASQVAVDTLCAGVPKTELLTPQNRDAMWAGRRHLFFKPSAGFGSKATYRGDKLTRRVWDEIASASYIAQEIVAPSERLADLHAAPFKVDFRCYAYRGKVLLYAARMYRGQTTNFRTPGGGFAPVLTGMDR